MKAAITMSFVFLMCSSGAQAQELDKDTAIAESKAVVKAFAGELQMALQSAMKDGGPVNAIDVCNTEAMPITADAAIKGNSLVSRVSLKNRNPENVPSEWQREILLDFDARALKGESIEEMASATVVEHSGKKQLRFMKALPTSGVCLACHGSDISSEVKLKIDELYPNDKATGYSLGEVRGAIVVVKDID